MKKRTTACFFLLLFSFSGLAQSVDKTVEKIRSQYTDIAEKARLCEDSESDAGEIGELFMNELVVNSRGHQWRAVGTHVLTYKFFYTGGDTERRMYPDELVMVKAERKESNRVYNEEFLFSRSGALIFYFQKAENDNDVPAERRVYFSGASPVRIIEDGKTRSKLTENDTKSAAEIRKNAAKITAVFQRSIAL